MGRKIMKLLKGRWPVEVGEEVLAFHSNRRGWLPAYVERIGNKLIHVADRPGGRTTPYRIEDGQLNTGYSGAIRTKTEHAAEERRIAVVKALLDTYGVEIEYRHKPRWSVEALEELFDAIGKINEKHHITKD